VARAILRTK